jgi:REP element-mobilizing transposase RayT
MPQSLACLHAHIIFSTKNREAVLSEALRAELDAYMTVVLQNLDCHPVIIKSVADHIHVLAGIARTISMSDAVKDIKTATSRWIKAREPKLNGFAWQSGYAAFAVSVSNIEGVRRYIANQEEHHKSRTFQEEYRAFLEKHHVPYEERYVWD